MIKKELNPEHGKRLKECLIDANMSQKDLAIKSKYTQQYISNIIVGKKNMSVESAKIFSKILKVREEYLLCEDNFKTQKQMRDIPLEKFDKGNVLAIQLLHLSGFVPICDFIGNWRELGLDTSIYGPFPLGDSAINHIPLEFEKQLIYSTEILAPSGDTFYCDMEDIHLLSYELIEYIRLRMKQLESKYAWKFDDARLSHRAVGSTISFYPPYTYTDKNAEYYDILEDSSLWMDHYSESFPNIEANIKKSRINKLGELI